MAVNNGKKQPPRQMAHHNVKVVGVSSKENFRRPVPKTYSYRYEVTGDAGPAGAPLVRAGAAIIESRYRGRGATWSVARSVVDPKPYLVRGGYVHPLEENPMSYPPRAHAAPEPAAAPLGRTPGFANQAVTKAAQPPVPIRRPAVARPTPANESAYKKTG